MERWYPSKIAATEKAAANDLLVSKSQTKRGDFLRAVFPSASRINIAEFGVWQGGSSVQFANFLDGQGELHLFDYCDTVQPVKLMIEASGYKNVHAWGCSYKHLDSYNWSLKKIMEDRPDLRFDYVYLDGAHTWAVDALTFFLCDRLLNDGGYIEFDDYRWRLRGSSLDPLKVPVISEQYTDEQIDDYQVSAIVDLLVKSRDDYTEITPNRIFRKTSRPFWTRWIK